jgi:hypothetical protein
MTDATTTTKVPTFCPLCVSRVGATAMNADGELVALGPDPRHPRGQALGRGGQAAVAARVSVSCSTGMSRRCRHRCRDHLD